MITTKGFDIMKIMNINNYETLFKFVDGLKGQVHLKTAEGDDIVLTSKLSRFLLESLKKQDDDLINELEIVCEDPEDTIRMIHFLSSANN